jgi:hypothetical protein
MYALKPRASNRLTWRSSELSTPFQKVANESKHRLLTREALIGAATVRERSAAGRGPRILGIRDRKKPRTSEYGGAPMV